MEKYRHKLFPRRVWGRRRTPVVPGRDLVWVPGQSLLRSPISYTTEKVTFLVILKVLLTTWNSDYFVPFWQYYYRLTRTLTSLTTQTSLAYGWMVTLLYTLRNFNTERDNKIHVWLRLLLDFCSSWIIHCFSLV